VNFSLVVKHNLNPTTLQKAQRTRFTAAAGTSFTTIPIQSANKSTQKSYYYFIIDNTKSAKHEPLQDILALLPTNAATCTTKS
jgi:hypothetical protein